MLAFAGGTMLGWSPRGTRGVVARLGGVALIAFGARRLVTRAVRDAGTRRRSVDCSFSLDLDQPVSRVFAFCSNFENFPRLIRTLREVRDSGDGHSHWCATTPSGRTIEWDAVTTKFVTNSVIAWRSVPGAGVHASGLLRFIPDGRRTRLTMQLRYDVLDTTLDDAIAALAAAPNDKQLASDIRRIEALLGSESPA
ncbi:MAG: SRPBCC family protein [Gemmatimonadaceae bacterium]|nr:SRPBCC family protein [Gemmatimonadaceae bacterium]